MYRVSLALLLVAACRPAPPDTPATRGSAEDVAARACGQVRAFAASHGWRDRIDDCFYDDVTVYAQQEAFFSALRSLHGLPDDFAFPVGVVAALEKRHLMVVSPSVFDVAAPEYAAGEDAWTRLMAHEIGHRLHVAVLDGDEEAMGPTWFYEGFAAVAANQELGAPLVYRSAEEALAGARDPGPLAYRRFAAAVRYFMQHKAPLPELVERAGDPAFEDWLVGAADEPD